MAREYQIMFMLPALTISFTSLPDGTDGVAYTGQATALGGTGSYTYTKTTGPAWMSVNSSSGAITGTPNATGTGITVTVTVTDSDGNTAQVTDTINIVSSFSPAAFNPSDKHANIVLTNSNRTVSSSATNFSSVRSTGGKSTGKYYVEGTVSGFDASTATALLGFANASADLSNYVGQFANGWSTYGVSPNTGWLSSAGNHSTSGQTIGAGSVLMAAIDVDAGKGWLGVVGQGWIGGGDPAAGTGESFTFSGGTTMYVGASAYSSGHNIVVNFGNAAFSGSVPSGFTSGWGV